MALYDKAELRAAPTRKLVYSMIAFVILGGWMGWQWLTSIGPQASSSSWPTITAEVMQSEHSFWIKRSFRFRYAYTTNGVSHESSRLQLNTLSSRWLFGKGGFAADHPLGSTLVVAYDPNAPGHATVHTGLSFHDFTIVPVFVLCGVFGCRIVWREFTRRRRIAETLAEKNSLPCTECGYNRRGLLPGSPCPECGHNDPKD